MERKLVTCPETAHLEQIEYESSPCGMLIASCTRFDPPGEVNCARECAARFDRKSRVDADTDPDAEAFAELGAEAEAEAEVDLEIALFNPGTPP
jgi:hypothetical protein